MAKVHLWASLRRFADGQEVVEVEMVNLHKVAEVVEVLEDIVKTIQVQQQQDYQFQFKVIQ